MKRNLGMLAVAAPLCAGVALLVGGARSGGEEAAGLAPPPAFAAQDPGPLAAYLRFTGSGSVQMRPDTATIWFSVRGRGETLRSAQDRASVAMRKLIAAIRAAGVDEADLRTEGGWSYGGWYEEDGLRVAMQSLTVTVRDIANAGALLAAGIDAGASDASGPSFSLSDQRDGYASALRKAIADARSKADAAAGLLGIDVTGVVSVDESPGYAPPPYVYGAAVEGAGTAPVPVEPGTQMVSATVTVVFSYATA